MIEDLMVWDRMLLSNKELVYIVFCSDYSDAFCEIQYDKTSSMPFVRSSMIKLRACGVLTWFVGRQNSWWLDLAL